MAQQVPWDQRVLDEFIRQALLSEEDQWLMRSRIGGMSRSQQAAQLIVAVSAAGTLNVQAYYNGVPVESSRKSLPVAVGSQEISLNDLIYLPVPDACGCNGVTVPLDIYAWTADSGAANISSIAVNLLREA